jgi:hypothetical protein
MRSQPEQILQRQVAEYLSYALIPPAWWTTIPAGGGGELRGKILKGLGYRSGTPDMMIIADGCVFFLELKSIKGRLSPAQKDTHAALVAAGCCVAVCRSLGEVRALWAQDGPWWPLRTYIRETRG